MGIDFVHKTTITRTVDTLKFEGHGPFVYRSMVHDVDRGYTVTNEMDGSAILTSDGVDDGSKFVVIQPGTVEEVIFCHSGNVIPKYKEDTDRLVPEYARKR